MLEYSYGLGFSRDKQRAIIRKGEMLMKKAIARRLICKFGTQLCAVAMVIAPLVSDVCKNKYYQAEEPEGLDAFADSQRSKLRG